MILFSLELIFESHLFVLFAVVQFVERHGRAYLLLEENEESFVYQRTKNQNGKDYWRCKDWNHKDYKCSSRAVTDLQSLLNFSGFHCHPSNLTHKYNCITKYVNKHSHPPPVEQFQSPV